MMPFDLVARDVRGALEVHVLHPVRHARLPGRFVLGADRYQHQTEASGAVCTSWTSTRQAVVEGLLVGAAAPSPGDPSVMARITTRCGRAPGRGQAGHVDRYCSTDAADSVRAVPALRRPPIAFPMADWKDTLNLPRTGFPDEGEPAGGRAGRRSPAGTPWTSTGGFAQRRRGRAEVRAARRPAVRQRPHPHRARAQQDPQGHRRQVAARWPASTRRTCPGWDCHGLPIELQVDRELGPEEARHERRRRPPRPAGRTPRSSSTCSARSSSGSACSGDWDEPVPDDGLRLRGGDRAGARARSSRTGSSTRARSRCTGASTAARRWPRPRSSTSRTTSPSIYVEFPLAADADADALARSACPALGGPRRLGAHLDDDAVDAPVEPGDRLSPGVRVRARTTSDGRVVIVAEALAEPRGARRPAAPFGAPVARVRRARRSRASGSAHPLYDARVAGRAGRLRHARAGHRCRAHGARPRRRRLPHRRSATASTSTRRSDATGASLDEVELFGGLQRVRGQPEVVADARASAARLWHRETFEHSYPHCWRCHKPVIFRATAAVVHRDGPRRPARATPLAAIDGRRVDPGVGPRSASRNMIADPPRLVHLAPARLGRADPGRRLRGVRRSRRSTPELVERAAGIFAEHGADAWYERPAEEFLPAGLDVPGLRRHRVRARARHPRRLVRLRRPATRRCSPCRAGAGSGRPTSTSRAATSTAAGSRARCSSASARAAGRRTGRC